MMMMMRSGPQGFSSWKKLSFVEPKQRQNFGSLNKLLCDMSELSATCPHSVCKGQYEKRSVDAFLNLSYAHTIQTSMHVIITKGFYTKLESEKKSEYLSICMP